MRSKLRVDIGRRSLEQPPKISVKLKTSPLVVGRLESAIRENLRSWDYESSAGADFTRN